MSPLSCTQTPAVHNSLAFYIFIVPPTVRLLSCLWEWAPQGPSFRCLLRLVTVKEQTEGAATAACNLLSMGPSGLPEFFLKGPKQGNVVIQTYDLVSVRNTGTYSFIKKAERWFIYINDTGSLIYTSKGLDPELCFSGGFKCLISLTPQWDRKCLGINIGSLIAHLNPTFKDSNQYVSVLKSYLFDKTSFWAFKLRTGKTINILQH